MASFQKVTPLVCSQCGEGYCHSAVARNLDTSATAVCAVCKHEIRAADVVLDAGEVLAWDDDAVLCYVTTA